MHIMTWAMVRYRLPVDAALLPLAALGAEVLCFRVHVALTHHRSRQFELPCEGI